LAVAQNKTFNVQVGSVASAQGGIFQYIPSAITAPVGSTIVFTWNAVPGNHTVTQSTATDPCNPLPGGFDSGFLLVEANVTTFPSWNITITNDAPIYFYCAQLLPSPHCNAGMVGSINAPATGNGSWTAVAAIASAATSAPPGQPTAGAPLQAVNASVTAPPGPVGTGSTASVQGFNLPGTASAGNSSASASGSHSGSSAGSSGSGSSGAPAPTTSGGSSGAMANAVSGVALFMSAVFGTLLL